MVSTTFPYHTLSIQKTDPTNLNRMLAALPGDVALFLASALEGNKVHLGMSKLELGVAHSFTWSCILSHTGLTVEIAPAHGGLTVNEVKRLEKNILTPHALSDPNLIVVPYSTEKTIQETMLRNLAKGDHWSGGPR